MKSQCVLDVVIDVSRRRVRTHVATERFSPVHFIYGLKTNEIRDHIQ